MTGSPSSAKVVALPLFQLHLSWSFASFALSLMRSVDLPATAGRRQPVAGVAVVVYTMAAYCADPEVDAVELGELTEFGATLVVVAVLAFAGPAPVRKTTPMD